MMGNFASDTAERLALEGQGEGGWQLTVSEWFTVALMNCAQTRNYMMVSHGQRKLLHWFTGAHRVCLVGNGRLASVVQRV